MDRKTARSEEIEEAADDVNAAAGTVDKTGTTSGQKFPSFTKFIAPLAVCWVTLLIIMSLRIYFTSVMSENNAKLNAANQNLTTQNQELNTKNKELETQNGNLDEKKQELEREKDGLAKKIQDMETKWNINVKQAQWSIDAYCPKENDNRQCEPCQKGWSHSQSSCYAINNAQPARQKTWDEAQEDCKGKGSDLAVIDNQDDKTFISNNSWWKPTGKGYWIGLRAEDGKWKWVDGTDLTETSWMQQHPATDGRCAISVHNEGWKSVNCSEKQMWICGKAALFV